MKFIIDTKRKIITLEESANFANFVETIQDILGKSWKDYTLERTTVYNWTYFPITIQPIVYPSIPAWKPTWHDQPTIICYDNSANNMITQFSVK